MFFFLSYFIITAVCVFFVVKAEQRTNKVSASLRNYSKWLERSEANLLHKEMALDSAYKCIDRLETRLLRLNDTLEDTIEPCEADALANGYAYDDDGELTELHFEEQMFDAMSWSPQHAGDSTCFNDYTDSNCSSAYGDEDTSDDC